MGMSFGGLVGCNTTVPEIHSRHLFASDTFSPAPAISSSSIPFSIFVSFSHAAISWNNICMTLAIGIHFFTLFFQYHWYEYYMY